MIHPVPYHLIRSKKRRRTISLQIKEDGRIFIYAPYRTPGQEIENFFDKNQPWIVKKLREKEGSVRREEKRFIPGEKFLFLGESYPLEIGDANDMERALRLSFGRFILDKDHVEKARDLFIRWYKTEAEERLAERVNYYCEKLRLFPRGIRITSAKHRWGSCSADDRLFFNWRIIMASMSIIDYVLIHEIAHIKEKNHSREFWGYLESIIPDYRRRRLWLRENGHSLWL